MTKRQTTRAAAAAVITLVSLGVVAPGASARSCVAQGVQIERGVFGTGFGGFVSGLAHEPEQFGVSRLGEFVSSLGRTSPDACPF
jgi:hypothetical protein